MEQDSTSCPKERQNKHKNCNRNKSQTQDFCILNPIKKEAEISQITISEEIRLETVKSPLLLFVFHLSQDYKDRKRNGIYPIDNNQDANIRPALRNHRSIYKLGMNLYRGKEMH